MTSILQQTYPTTSSQSIWSEYFFFSFPEVALTLSSIKEGDVFYALATFVSETGEAMNLVEGERVYVLEWNNQVRFI